MQIETCNDPAIIIFSLLIERLNGSAFPNVFLILQQFVCKTAGFRRKSIYVRNRRKCFAKKITSLTNPLTLQGFDRTFDELD